MDFSSDNASGVSAPILAALIEALAGTAPAYGADDATKAAERQAAAIFDHACTVMLVATGTASNGLALAALTPPWGGVLCHENAHVNDDECGAPEFFTSGAKLVGIPGAMGKIDPAALAETLDRFPRGVVKQVQAAAVSLSEATECGTLYTPGEIARLCGLAHDAGLKVHMDGARFANAVAATGASPADLTWRAGVDILTLGATKNGAMACEAIVVFDPALAATLPFQRKRGGHTLSKGRVLGAQMLAYLTDGHWLALAAHSNAMAATLSRGLAALAGCRLPWPTEVNEVFAVVPRAVDAAWRGAGARYYDWGTRGLPEAIAPREGEVFVRLVTSFATQADEVTRLLDIARAA